MARWNTPEYRTWQSMKNRCLNPKDKYFHCYGGRGISVCDRWMTFDNFLFDMGPRKKGLQLDRLNNDLGYFPENCRWTTPKNNANNRRTSLLIEHDGKEMTASQWARALEMNKATFLSRYHAGWPMSQIIELKPSKFNTHSGV